MRLQARRTTLALAVVAVLMCAATTASADTVVIGSQNLPAGGLHQLCGGNPCVGMQGAVAPASAGTYTLSSPVDGTIVSWSFRNGNVLQSNSYELRVLRPTNAQQTQFTAVGTSAPQIILSNDDLIRGSFPVSIPIKAGDRIGIQGTGPDSDGFDVPVFTSGVAGDGARYFQPPIADGGPATT